jgi:hypothetical protein
MAELPPPELATTTVCAKCADREVLALLRAFEVRVMEPARLEWRKAAREARTNGTDKDRGATRGSDGQPAVGGVDRLDVSVQRAPALLPPP